MCMAKRQVYLIFLFALQFSLCVHLMHSTQRKEKERESTNIDSVYANCASLWFTFASPFTFSNLLCVYVNVYGCYGMSGDIYLIFVLSLSFCRFCFDFFFSILIILLSVHFIGPVRGNAHIYFSPHTILLKLEQTLVRWFSHIIKHEMCVYI